MNLLYTATSYPPAIGGAQLHLHELARRLARRHQVRVVTHWTTNRTDWLLGTTLRAPGPRPLYARDGVPVYPLTLTAAERVALAPWALGYYAVKGPAIDRISAVLEGKLAAVAERVDLVHNSRIGREGLSYASLKLARARGVPFFFTPNHHPRWVGWNYQHYLRLYREADGLIALTPHEKAELVQLGAHPDHVHVTGIGPILAEQYDAAAFQARVTGGAPFILFLGQKYAYKGCDALLKAAPLVWARHPEAHFVFLGPRTPYSEGLFASVSDPRVHEMGSVSLDDKTAALAACQCLCLPSSQESFGGVLVEAWSLGKPVLAGDIPAMRDVVSEGVDGYLVAQDPGLIAERLVYLLDHPTIGSGLGANGQRKVEARYTWDRIAEAIEAAYQGVVEGRGAREAAG